MTSESKSVLLEEKRNAYSHGMSIFLALLGSYVLLKDTNSEIWISFFIYSTSLVLLFTSSTLYHATSNPAKKKKLRILDHISIYYLIAGTYTPVCLTLLEDSRGILLLYLVWGIVFFGTILKLFFTGKFEIFSLVLYGVMGWLVIIDLQCLMVRTSYLEKSLLALGGFFYTVGILFYAIKKIPFNHFIWHLFVLGGAISHWWFVYSIRN